MGCLNGAAAIRPTHIDRSGGWRQLRPKNSLPGAQRFPARLDKIPCPRGAGNLPQPFETAAPISQESPRRQAVQKKFPAEFAATGEPGDSAWTRFAASAKVSAIHQEYDMAYVVAIIAPGEM